MAIFYHPVDGVAGDFIPFYWQGIYHLFYLKDYRDPAGHGEGTPWWHITTRDFVHFDDLGEALPRGSRESQDLAVFTGSVIAAQDMFHIFYTGHNSRFQGTARPVQVVMHATSQDLKTWHKDPDFFLTAPIEAYEKDDWRDPFVFWNEEAGAYWMLLAARKRSGPSRHRGCIALATSPDLIHWTVRPPFWAPDEYYTHECPDLFKMGDWWYLIYSTFSDRCVTHYRMSRHLEGPWLAPVNDTFDDRAFYAAKTAGDGQRRFAFGWLPTRKGEKDSGDWEWGGALVVHELVQRPDGTLVVCPPQEILAAFDRRVAPQLAKAILGKWTPEADGSLSTASVGRFSALSLGAMPDECLLEATLTFEPGTAACGLLLRAERQLAHYYQVRLEPARQRLVMDRWPRPGDQPFMLERPLALRPGAAIHLRAIVSGTSLVVYAACGDDQVALSCRLYDHREGDWGLFVTEGVGRFGGLALRAVF